MLVTVPVSLLSATALLVLNELLRLEVDVLPLLAAAVPLPSARASPRVSRLLPELLLLFRSDWFLLSELLFCSALPYSLALGPAPVCVDVAVAVWAPAVPVPLLPLVVGLATAAPNAKVMAAAKRVFFI